MQCQLSTFLIRACQLSKRGEHERKSHLKGVRGSSGQRPGRWGGEGGETWGGDRGAPLRCEDRWTKEGFSRYFTVPPPPRQLPEAPAARPREAANQALHPPRALLPGCAGHIHLPLYLSPELELHQGPLPAQGLCV